MSRSILVFDAASGVSVICTCPACTGSGRTSPSPTPSPRRSKQLAAAAAAAAVEEEREDGRDVDVDAGGTGRPASSWAPPTQRRSDAVCRVGPRLNIRSRTATVVHIVHDERDEDAVGADVEFGPSVGADVTDGADFRVNSELNDDSIRRASDSEEAKRVLGDAGSTANVMTLFGDGEDVSSVKPTEDSRIECATAANMRANRLSCDASPTKFVEHSRHIPSHVPQQCGAVSVHHQQAATGPGSSSQDRVIASGGVVLAHQGRNHCGGSTPALRPHSPPALMRDASGNPQQHLQQQPRQHLSPCMVAIGVNQQHQQQSHAGWRRVRHVASAGYLGQQMGVNGHYQPPPPTAPSSARELFPPQQQQGMLHPGPQQQIQHHTPQQLQIYQPRQPQQHQQQLHYVRHPLSQRPATATPVSAASSSSLMAEYDEVAADDDEDDDPCRSRGQQQVQHHHRRYLSVPESNVTYYHPSSSSTAVAAAQQHHRELDVGVSPCPGDRRPATMNVGEYHHDRSGRSSVVHSAVARVRDAEGRADGGGRTPPPPQIHHRRYLSVPESTTLTAACYYRRPDGEYVEAAAATATCSAAQCEYSGRRSAAPACGDVPGVEFRGQAAAPSSLKDRCASESGLDRIAVVETVNERSRSFYPGRDGDDDGVGVGAVTPPPPLPASCCPAVDDDDDEDEDGRPPPPPPSLPSSSSTAAAAELGGDVLPIVDKMNVIRVSNSYVGGNHGIGNKPSGGKTGRGGAGGNKSSKSHKRRTAPPQLDQEGRDAAGWMPNPCAASDIYGSSSGDENRSSSGHASMSEGHATTRSSSPPHGETLSRRSCPMMTMSDEYDYAAAPVPAAAPSSSSAAAAAAGDPRRRQQQQQPTTMSASQPSGHPVAPPRHQYHQQPSSAAGPPSSASASVNESGNVKGHRMSRHQQKTGGGSGKEDSMHHVLPIDGAAGIEEIRAALHQLTRGGGGGGGGASTSSSSCSSKYSTSSSTSSSCSRGGKSNNNNNNVKGSCASASDRLAASSNAVNSNPSRQMPGVDGGGVRASATASGAPPSGPLARHSSLETVNTNVTAADEFVWVDSHNRLVELQQLPWTAHDVLKVVRRHQSQLYVCSSNASSASAGSGGGVGIGDACLTPPDDGGGSSPREQRHHRRGAAAGHRSSTSKSNDGIAAAAVISEGRVSTEVVPRLSYLLQRVLVRVGREVQRLSKPLGMCSKQEVAAGFKIVLSSSLADSCVKACLRASAMYAVSGDQLKQSKSVRAGLQLSVGRFHRWMADVKLGRFIHEYAAVYMAAGLENLLEEIVSQCMPVDPESMLTTAVLEASVASNVDLWGLLQPNAHLSSGRTAAGVLALPRWPSSASDSWARTLASMDDHHQATNTGSSSGSSSSGIGSSVASSSSAAAAATGAGGHHGAGVGRSVEQSLLTTCVGSLDELRAVLCRVANFHGAQFNKPAGRGASAAWSPAAVHALFYFMRCSQLEHAKHGDSRLAPHSPFCAPIQELTWERPFAVLPPVVEWVRVASAHAEYRSSQVVDQDDVMQTARLLLPGVDCPNRMPGFLSNFEERSYPSRREEKLETAEKLKIELAFRMLSSGRTDLLPHALQLLPNTKVNTVNENGFTPLMLACLYDDESVVRYLIDAGADVNAETPAGGAHADAQYWTALTYAALVGDPAVVRCLLDHGAHVEGGARANEDEDRCAETPLQVATAYGNGEVVALLLSRGADPFLATTMKDTLCYSGSAQRGSPCAIAVAASHGQRMALHKLLSNPLNRSAKKDMLSLEEILAEGSSSHGTLEKKTRLLHSIPSGKDEARPPYGGRNTVSDCAQVLKLTKAQVRILQEAMYHSSEGQYLDITLDLRSLGVPWTLHCWMHTLAAAHEHRLENIIDQLLQDFLQVWPDDYSPQFVDECLPLLFSIFRYSKNEGTTLLLADIFSSCFGREPVREVKDTAFEGGAARIDPKFVNSPDLSDVRFRVEGRLFFAHKIILVNASPRFRQMLAGPRFSGHQDGEPPVVQINDIRYDVFEMVMQYLYQGGREEIHVGQNDVLELMAAANFFQLDGLLRFCESKCSRMVDLDNIVSMYIHAKVYNAVHLLGYCQGFLIQNMVALLTYDDSVRRLIFGKKLHNHDVLSGLLLTLQTRVRGKRARPQSPEAILGQGVQGQAPNFAGRFF